MVLNAGSVTYRHDGVAEEVESRLVVDGPLDTECGTAFRNHSSFQRPPRNAPMSLIGLIGTSISSFG